MLACMHPYTCVNQTLGEFILSVYHVGSGQTYVIRLVCNGLHSLSHLVGPPYDFFSNFPLWEDTKEISLKLAFLFKYPNF